jgi:hypothetical protein
MFVLQTSYGMAVQLATPADTSAPLDAAARTRLQEVIGTLLYYARAVDFTMSSHSAP